MGKIVLSNRVFRNIFIMVLKVNAFRKDVHSKTIQERRSMN